MKKLLGGNPLCYVTTTTQAATAAHGLSSSLPSSLYGFSVATTAADAATTTPTAAAAKFL